MNVTFVYCTSRDNPKYEWFAESLTNQIVGLAGKRTRIIVVRHENTRLPKNQDTWPPPFDLQIVLAPKPNVWSGASRITKQDWWSKSNDLNTAICFCRTDYISFIDDRCVLMPGYLDAIERLMYSAHPYVLLGAYEKRTGMTVQNGVIENGGIVVGKDDREAFCEKNFTDPRHHLKPPYKAYPSWVYGCSITLPLEWVLQVNGFSEICDGMGGEDTMFGLHLAKCGFPIFYDPRVKMIEDRTPADCGPVMRREDKGVSPNDKSHALLDRMGRLEYAPNNFDLRKLRKDALDGKPWSIPTAPTNDWYDGQPLNEM